MANAVITAHDQHRYAQRAACDFVVTDDEEHALIFSRQAI